MALLGLQGKGRGGYLRLFRQFSENSFQAGDARCMVLVGGHEVSLEKEEERPDGGQSQAADEHPAGEAGLPPRRIW